MNLAKSLIQNSSLAQSMLYEHFTSVCMYVCVCMYGVCMYVCVCMQDFIQLGVGLLIQE